MKRSATENKPKGRRAFLISAAAFIVISILLLGFLQALLVPKYMSFPYDGALVREYYDSEPCHDVIFLGDCEFYESVNPAVIWSEYGIPCYVRGSSTHTEP